MVLFRCLSKEEIINMMHGDNKKNKIYLKGYNTFTYDEEDYKHFFLYADHAKFFKGLDNYLLIGEYIIPDEIIDQYGFGYYYGLSTRRNNTLSISDSPIPEVIIKQSNFDKKYLYNVDKSLNSEFQQKILKDDDNEKYKEEIEPYFNCPNLPLKYRYSYAEVYYELVVNLIKKYNLNYTDEVVEYLDCKNLSEQINRYFYDNVDYFEEQTKKYIKERKH